jgi:3-methyladenine DNA glycosylase/8-oxoguanine DNA glycosylase
LEKVNKNPIANHNVDGRLAINLSYQPPYDWEAALAYLKNRGIRGIEVVDGNLYSRSIEIDGHISYFQIRPAKQDAHFDITFHRLPENKLPYMSFRVREMFDLDINPLIIVNYLGRDKYLAPIISRYPGLRLIGCWDKFEMTVRVIVGQQVTLTSAAAVLSRLVQRYGREISQPHIPGITHVFPKPEVLAKLDTVSAGMPVKRAEAIKCLAQKVCSGDIVFDGTMSSERIIQGLKQIPGVGQWTTDYVAMRVLKEPDAFPLTDLVIKRMLERVKQTARPAVDIKERIDSWSPWRAYVAIYFWKEYAAKLELPKAFDQF